MVQASLRKQRAAHARNLTLSQKGGSKESMVLSRADSKMGSRRDKSLGGSGMHQDEFASAIRDIGRGQTIEGFMYIDQVEANLQKSKKITTEIDKERLKISSMKQSGKMGSFASNQSINNMIIRERDCLTFLDHGCTAFKLKGRKPLEKGQYRIPFTMKLPQKLPGSFCFEKKAKGDSENLKISYTFECFVDGLKYEMRAEKEIQIRQFLFTGKEITDDLNYQKVIIQF